MCRQYDFWHDDVQLARLAAAQGVTPIRRLEDLWGKASELWDDDADFELFLAATKGNTPEGRSEDSNPVDSVEEE